MRHFHAAFPALLAVFLLGCSEEPQKPKELKRLGNACTANDECGSGLCQHGACTRICDSQGDCPWGLDCGRQAPEDATATCYLAQYPSPQVGGFGTSCALYAKECGGEANPCAPEFYCLAAETCDPDAVCSRTCSSDRDCPPTMFCGTDADEVKGCLPRGSCSECATDDQCPEQHVCVTGVDGDRFCAKTCGEQSDCLKPEKEPESGEFLFEPFEACVADRGDATRTACQPASGRCHGASTIETQPIGGICAGCRRGHPEDCAEGYGCYESPNGERFCTKECTIRVKFTPDGAVPDGHDCPDGASCYFYVPPNCPNNGCDVPSLCNGDTTYRGLSCYPPLVE